MRRLLFLGLALCSVAHAATLPRIDLAATPAWKGWSRPGRATEIDIRLSADAATRMTLDVMAGPHTVRADVDLQPGRVVRLHIPLTSVERIAVTAASTAGPSEQRSIDIAQSESPLLGLGLVTGDRFQFEGFHTVAFGADDLPRNASAYSSIDALILDAPTLGALDQRQLGALLAHAAGCGRIVVLNADPRVRRVLDGAGGCGGRALMSAVSLTEAREMLASSLASSMPPAMARGGIDGVSRPDHVVWSRVAVLLAVAFAAAALTLLFFSSLPALLLMPAIASVAALALLHAMQPPSQLIVWSEGESAAPVARYQAWQQFPGVVRERARVPIPPQLAFSAQPCDPTQPMRFDFDAGSGRATFAEFETRLFRQISLCYAGSFPISRAITIEARPDGLREVRNAGSTAWPAGVLVAGGLVHDLPTVGPGAHLTLAAGTGRAPQDVVARTALARTQDDGVAALWALELDGVADAPVESKGWLLVSMPRP